MAQPPRHRRPAAFSLIELVLVALIVGMLAAVAVPRYARASANVRLEAAARKVAADLAYAAELARTRSGEVVVTFGPAAGDVSTSYLDPGPTTVTANFTELAASPYNVSSVSADFGGDGVVTYDGYGRPDSGGTVHLSVGGRLLTLAVDAETGEATLP